MCILQIILTEGSNIMKHNFFKISAVIFILGLVVIGIGFGVALIEFNNINIVEASSDYMTTECFSLNLPDEGMPLYYKNNSDYDSFTITNDEAIPHGQLKYYVTHSKYTDSVNVNITRDYYLYDRDNVYISEHRINYLNDISYNYKPDEEMELREFLYNIKRGVLFDAPETDCIIVEIKINPLDRDRLTELTGNKTAITYRQYLEEFKDSDDV